MKAFENELTEAQATFDSTTVVYVPYGPILIFLN
jgi:hypothetical protein